MIRRYYRLAFLLLVFSLIGTPAHAEHFNRAAFVPAYEPCDPDAVNATTSTGIEACSPAIPVSDCETAFDTALVLGPKGGGAITYRHSGRREAQIFTIVPTVDFRTKVVLKDVRRCNGDKFTGEVTLAFVFQMFDTDPTCGPQGCVLPEFPLQHKVRCRRGRCKLLFNGDDVLRTEGRPPFPSDRPFTSHYSSIKVLDLANRPFLTIGVNSGSDHVTTLTANKKEGLVSWFARLLHNIRHPAVAYAYDTTNASHMGLSLTRFVQAYEPCNADSTDSVTSEGLPACKAVPVSKCGDDPGNAVRAVVEVAEDTNTGRGKVKLRLEKNGRVIMTGDIGGIHHCDGTPYSGPLELDIMGRATMEDAVCGAASCTTVDTTLFSTQLQLTDGQGVIGLRDRWSAFGPFPGDATNIAAELTEGRILDPSGHVALISPASLVRCSQHITSDGHPFCYSN